MPRFLRCPCMGLGDMGILESAQNYGDVNLKADIATLSTTTLPYDKLDCGSITR